MPNEKYLFQAQALLRRIEGRSLSLEERRTMAIELAALLLYEARDNETAHDQRTQTQLARMMDDPAGRAFTAALTDQLFRSNQPSRAADQCLYLIDKYGIPAYLSTFKRLQLSAFEKLGGPFAKFLVPLVRREIRRQTAQVIFPAERSKLIDHLLQREASGVRINLNHLGEAILGEDEAKLRLELYLEDLRCPEIEYISIKISTIYSQINLLAWEETLTTLSERLRLLYREAQRHYFVKRGGSRVQKFVNLDMEEYRDLSLTVALFRRVLDEPEFFHYSAGIVLQSYLPDAHLIQQELTVWAMQRSAAGGAPIKVRLVKGANLANEQVEAAIRSWPQAPYQTKEAVDANYKHMLHYGCKKAHAAAVHLGVASHNLFDISYTLLLRAENGVEADVNFEMLEGMADPIRHIVQKLTGDILLYCPVAEKDQFQYAVAYLVRRLQENTAPQNFLRHFFALMPGTPEWRRQAKQFSKACHGISLLDLRPRRRQNRYLISQKITPDAPFANEPDTDWSLPQNRKWIWSILEKWQQKQNLKVPLSIAGSQLFPSENSPIGKDPSRPSYPLYRYRQASESDAENSLEAAKKAQAAWGATSVEDRSQLLVKTAQLFREHRGELIAAMVADGGKLVVEADGEVSEAIDFLEYYLREAVRLHQMSDILWRPRGTVLIASPWNFPCSIPVGGIAGSLAAGNCVIFKPSPETVLVGWKVAELFWQAGFSKEVVQFIAGEDHTIGSQLVKDPRIDLIILTGSTETAKLMLQMRPGLSLLAETGGKNAMIVTAMADRDLAVRDIIQSAFSHSGQKCSACSLLICEREVYNDPRFKQQLTDAAASLKAGSAWDFSSRINPLIGAPQAVLKQGLTLLEEGEEWLLKPQEGSLPNLWSPGIKWGVTKKSFTYHHELFGPVLSVMCADNLLEAIRLANSTPYGLTAGLQSLDEREQLLFSKEIEAGNCYINRTMTGAIVRRQPFGGCKASSFGIGAKAGGPNYVMSLMQPEEISLPAALAPLDSPIKNISDFFERQIKDEEQQQLWRTSLASYQYHWNQTFSKDHDPSLLLGQDNTLRYIPYRQVVLRLQHEDKLIDLLRIIAAALICGTSLEVSGSSEQLQTFIQSDWSTIRFVQEMEAQFIVRIQRERLQLMRIRLLRPPSEALSKALAEAAVHLQLAPVLANGRLELMNYLRELSLSVDYHRSGYLGIRENEERTPIP